MKYAIQLEDWRSTRTLYAIRSTGCVTAFIERAVKFKSRATAEWKAKQYKAHNPKVIEV